MFGVASVGVEWLYDSIAEWKRLEVTNYLLEPMCQNRVLISIDTTKEEEIDPSDEAIVSGLWEHKDDVYIKFGQDDWNSMNKEIEEAMDDTSEDDLQQDDEEEYDWDELLDGELEVALNDESYTRNSSMTPPLTRKRLRSNDEDSNHSSGSAKGKRK